MSQDKMTPFEIANNINLKTGILDAQEVGYVPFVVNKVFSNTEDSIFYANEMNQAWALDVDQQYAFYYHGLPKKKRFGKWHKNQDTMQDIELIQEAFGYSYHKAKEVLPLLRPHLDSIRAEMDKGGKGNGK